MMYNQDNSLIFSWGFTSDIVAAQFGNKWDRFVVSSRKN